MKLFTGIKLENLAVLDVRGGGIEDMMQSAALAKVAKSLDGQTMNRSGSRMESLKPAAFDEILPWVRRKRGHIALVRKNHMIVVFKNGFMEVSKHGALDNDSKIRIYRRAVRRRGRRVKNGPVRGTIDVGIDLTGSARWVSDTIGQFKSLMEPFQVTKPAKKIEKKIHVISFTKSGIRLKPIAAFEDEIERGNYTDPILKKFDRAVAQLSSKDPVGRLLILHGPPGTGKTYMIRSMVNAIRGCRCVLVPSQFIPQFTTPTFGSMLLRQRKPVCLIIEDADSLLVERAADNITAIHSMLNLADGIFGQVADVRLVCTTNASKLDIEPAMLRAGRLLDHIRVGNLDPRHASDVLKRISGKEHTFDKRVSLADVYAAANENHVEQDKPGRIGFGS